MQFIVVKDNGTDHVPAREEWATIDKPTATEAAIEYCRLQGIKEGELEIHTMPLAMYEQQGGWGGCMVRTLTLRFSDQDKEAAAAEYEAKRQARVERFEDRAADAKREANQLSNRARQMADVIPFGQPILIGHHSEGRDRRYRGRIENTFRKSAEAFDKAQYYEQKAASASRNGAVYADDPKAETKLQQKIREAEELQAIMKACNAAIRKHAAAGREAQIKALVELGRTEAQAAELITPDFCGRIGFPDYALQNNNANIRRMKKRVEIVTTNQAAPAVKIEGPKATFEDCPADNRIRLFFPGKPPEDVRTRLKSAGFRWAPSEGAWQAFRTWHAEQVGKAEAGILEPQPAQ